MNTSNATQTGVEAHPLAVRCLETVWRSVLAPADSLEHWLATVAREVQRAVGTASGAEEGVAATRLALLHAAADHQQAWRPMGLGVCTDRHAARGGDEGEEVGAALVLATRRDWPAWCKRLGVLGTGEMVEAFTVGRGDLVPDAEWAAHPLHKARMLLGFDEMIVSCAAVPEEGRDREEGDGGLVLVLQFDRGFERTWDGEGLLETARLVTPYLARMLWHCVWRPLRRHRALLSRVSPIQREILPMLAEGRTEREIAGRMHRSPHTIHDHVKTIYAILGISSRVELLDAWHGLSLCAGGGVRDVLLAGASGNGEAVGAGGASGAGAEARAGSARDGAAYAGA